MSDSEESKDDQLRLANQLDLATLPIREGRIFATATLPGHIEGDVIKQCDGSCEIDEQKGELLQVDPEEGKSTFL